MMSLLTKLFNVKNGEVITDFTGLVLFRYAAKGISTPQGRARDLFLESPGNLSGPQSHF